MWEAGGWTGHLCGLPVNNFTLTLGKGYFVKMTRAARWSHTGTAPAGAVRLDLEAGWNLVALPGRAAAYDAQALLAAVEAAAGTTGIAREVDRWEAGGWEGHIHNLPVNRFSLEEGRGYFLKLTRAVAWTP